MTRALLRAAEGAGVLASSLLNDAVGSIPSGRMPACTGHETAAARPHLVQRAMTRTGEAPLRCTGTTEVSRAAGWSIGRRAFRHLIDPAATGWAATRAAAERTDRGHRWRVTSDAFFDIRAVACPYVVLVRWRHRRNLSSSRNTVRRLTDAKVQHVYKKTEVVVCKGFSLFSEVVPQRRSFNTLFLNRYISSCVGRCCERSIERHVALSLTRCTSVECCSRSSPDD